MRRLGECVCRPYAIVRDFWNETIGGRFGQFLIDARSCRSCGRHRGRAARGHGEFLLGARLAVDDRHRHRVCGGDCRLTGRRCRRGLPILDRAGGIGCLRRCGRQFNRDLRMSRHDHAWFSAERIVADNRPNDKHCKEESERTGDELRQADFDGARASLWSLPQRRGEIIHYHA